MRLTSDHRDHFPPRSSPRSFPYHRPCAAGPACERTWHGAGALQHAGEPGRVGGLDGARFTVRDQVAAARVASSLARALKPADA